MTRRFHPPPALVLFLATVTACGHTPWRADIARAGADGGAAVTVPGTHPTDATQGAGAMTTRDDTVTGTCPLPVARAGLVLARVGTAVITACDVAVAWEALTREGYRVDDGRAVLQSLVRDALLATEHPAGTRDAAVDRLLADALIRAEALTALARERPDEATVERYHEAHRDDFTVPDRVHLREVVLPTRAMALAVIHDLSTGVPFETVVTRTVDPGGRRDGGDLGYVPRSGSTGVPDAVVNAGFALAEPGDVTAEPLQVTTEIPGRRHPRRVTAWHVVQLVQRVPAETLEVSQARRRIMQRLTRDRYLTLRREARARWQQTLRNQVEAAVDAAGLRRVQVAPR